MKLFVRFKYQDMKYDINSNGYLTVIIGDKNHILEKINWYFPCCVKKFIRKIIQFSQILKTV